MKKTIKETRVATFGDFLHITSTCEITQELYSKICNQNILKECNDVQLYHNCISKKGGSIYSALTLIVPISMNALDKIVELSNLLTNYHYDLLVHLTQYQTYLLLVQAVKTKNVVSHDIIKKRKKTPWDI